MRRVICGFVMMTATFMMGGLTSAQEAPIKVAPVEALGDEVKAVIKVDLKGAAVCDKECVQDGRVLEVMSKERGFPVLRNVKIVTPVNENKKGLPAGVIKVSVTKFDEREEFLKVVRIEK